MSIALVTRGSTGLGAAFAQRLASEGYDLVLVARSRERLDAVAAAIRAEHGVGVEVLPADLEVPAERVTVERRLDGTVGGPVEVLVNNAGVESCEVFDRASPAALQAEVDLNITAVLQLTRAALSGMADGEARVVDLTGRLEFTQATVSARLACLRDCGLVSLRAVPWVRPASGRPGRCCNRRARAAGPTWSASASSSYLLIRAAMCSTRCAVRASLGWPSWRGLSRRPWRATAMNNSGMSGTEPSTSAARPSRNRRTTGSMIPAARKASRAAVIIGASWATSLPSG
ncbi:SDR family NAD(P)-dependent oxidoreductase [Pseudonocardia sp.]|jgi:NAD(P)-dependent dehydrogenase (short-subunit alcohol dehydrogenase family)|uniref:SDR family NAD(P)-dependent oxidoreductase n=1 Tax=Pseudonocardia sp. TaxID=60912 RepID=UPI0031FDDE19